ncbi:MAG TPA: DUF4340 domain-containing protein [Anaerolineales bacterium]
MIRRNTWLLLLILAALVGFAFYLSRHKAQQTASATPTVASGAAASAPLFATADGNPTDISIKDTTGKSVDVARNESGVWVLKAPTDAAANQASAEAAATQLTSLRVLASPQLGFDVVGLTQPSYTIFVKFSSGKSHTLAVGAVTPIQDGYYTSLDSGAVRIVDKQGLDSIIQLLAQPPYETTPTPPVTMAPTATPMPATPSSEATGSPAAPVTTETPGATVPAPSATQTP